MYRFTKLSVFLISGIVSVIITTALFVGFFFLNKIWEVYGILSMVPLTSIAFLWVYLFHFMSKNNDDAI